MGIVQTELVCAHSSGSFNPWGFISIDVNGDVIGLEKCCNSLDCVTHHGTPNVICVVVTHEHSGDLHAIG
jgi:hypothetical protein